MHPLRCTARYLALPISGLILAACQPASETPVIPNFIRVESGNSTLNRSNIEAVINSAIPGSHIQITEGRYLINNPITIRANGISLKGKGPDKSILLAKNANKPIFKLEADGITIEALTIDGLIADGPRRASFAIQIGEGYSHCRIAHTRILNVAASAIVGYSASGCNLIGNIIVNSGGDGVRLRGDHLTAIGNIIFKYFDEGLDLANGVDIVAIGNQVANGRIGIVVDDSSRALITNNYVENQIQEGIVVGADIGSVISDNTVRNAGYYAYNLSAPRIVSFNQSDGMHDTGFRISDISNGIILCNIDRGSKTDFLTNKEVLMPVPLKNDEGIKLDDLTIASQIRGITFKINCGEASDDNTKITIRNSYLKQPSNERNHEGIIKAVGDAELFDFSNIVEVKGETATGENRAKKVASLLKYNNPGFISVHVDGHVMKSEITAELYESLKDVGQSGITRLRAPFMSFRGNNPVSSLWYLSRDKTNVIVVSSMYGGASVRFFLLNDGKLSLMNSIRLLKEKVLLKLFH